VLLDDDGRALGAAPKASVHHTDTPLHLAFSCYVFDRRGRLLLTRRAWHKATFPGVWTNSCCGHPAPGEPIAEAVRRRTRQELGLSLGDVQLVLPAFRYVATMASGVRENELCPVYVATTGEEPRPDSEEVADHRWGEWSGFRDEILEGRLEVSPWCGQQVAALATVETAPAQFRPGSPDLLPMAARVPSATS
jgi:isopentenyl-diphosphate delta-isomerase